MFLDDSFSVSYILLFTTCQCQEKQTQNYVSNALGTIPRSSDILHFCCRNAIIKWRFNLVLRETKSFLLISSVHCQTQNNYIPANCTQKIVVKTGLEYTYFYKKKKRCVSLVTLSSCWERFFNCSIRFTLILPFLILYHFPSRF